MKNLIKENIENPEQLEKLYRSDRKGFAKAFSEIYPEISEHPASAFWKARLEPDTVKADWLITVKKDLLFLLVTCALAGFFIKFPAIFRTEADMDAFYIKNAGLVVIGALTLYYLLTVKGFKVVHLIFTTLIFFVSAIYINLLPGDVHLNTVLLACLHLPVILWFIYGLVYSGFNLREKSGWINYIRYNGELAVMFGVIAIAGGVLTAVTIGLFDVININAERFYSDYVVIIGAVSAPVAATFLIRYFPAITSKIPPVIASIFSPLVLLTLIIYLLVILLSGKSLYTNRDFLLVFNVMLLGVTAIIVFSVSETTFFFKQRLLEVILLALVIFAIITDLLALSAIIYRLGEYGFTPNRTAVLGSNLLILGNLVLFARDLYRVNFKKDSAGILENTIAKYLPVYAIWAVIVVFIFPVIFGLR